MCFFDDSNDNNDSNDSDVDDDDDGRAPRRNRVRKDPILLPSREFNAWYRFSKEAVQFLADTLRPNLICGNRTNRGRPKTEGEIFCLSVLDTTA